MSEQGEQYAVAPMSGPKRHNSITSMSGPGGHNTPEKRPDVVLTEPFRTTSGDYFAVLLSEWLPRYGWILFIPILATAGFGCMLHDERWLIVALMLVFIVAPMVMSFLYTYYMLSPEARRAILYKRVEIVPGCHLRLLYEHEPQSKTDSKDYTPQPQTKTDGKDYAPLSQSKADGGNYAPPLPPAETIAWSDVLRIRRTSRFQVYILRGERMQFILIPHSAISAGRKSRHQ